MQIKEKNTLSFQPKFSKRPPTQNSLNILFELISWIDRNNESTFGTEFFSDFDIKTYFEVIFSSKFLYPYSLRTVSL